MPKKSYETNLQTVVALSACPKCKSTERTKYHNSTSVDCAGVRNGAPYTSIEYKRTSCVDCGQHRVDRFYPYRP